MKTYWAQIVERDEEQDPACVMGSADPKEAAQSRIIQFVEKTEGEVRSGAVRVWPYDRGTAAATTFDWTASFIIPDDPQVDENDEFEVEAQIQLVARA